MMTFQETAKFETGLHIGSKVQVRWTACSHCYLADGTVVKLNDKSIVVEVDEAVPHTYGSYSYERGHRISAPRRLGRQWSLINGVFPSEAN